MAITWLHARFIEVKLDRFKLLDNIKDVHENKKPIQTLVESTDAMLEAFTKEVRAFYNSPESSVFVDYPKNTIDSILWETVNTIQMAAVNELNHADLPFLIEFLSTDPGNEKQAWELWSKYWSSLRYTAHLDLHT